MTPRCLILTGWAAATLAFGQTTQGLMSGRMVDALTGKPLAGAAFECDGSSSDSHRRALTDETGHFVVPLVSPGMYRVRASAENYQAQEIYGLEVRVAGEVEFSFRLHPLKDVWQSGKSGSVFFPENQTVVNFYGPDLDTSRSISVPVFKVARGALETAVSQVVDPVQIEELPLAGRDSEQCIDEILGCRLVREPSHLALDQRTQKKNLLFRRLRHLAAMIKIRPGRNEPDVIARLHHLRFRFQNEFLNLAIHSRDT